MESIPDDVIRRIGDLEPRVFVTCRRFLCLSSVRSIARFCKHQFGLEGTFNRAMGLWRSSQSPAMCEHMLTLEDVPGYHAGRLWMMTESCPVLRDIVERCTTVPANTRLELCPISRWTREQERIHTEIQTAYRRATPLSDDFLRELTEKPMRVNGAASYAAERDDWETVRFLVVSRGACDLHDFFMGGGDRVRAGLLKLDRSLLCFNDVFKSSEELRRFALERSNLRSYVASMKG